MTDIVEKLRKMGEISVSVARRAADEIERLRAELDALKKQEPVARFLEWNGPSHWPIPHGGVVARSFEEFPREAAEDSGSYWKNGALLYLAPQPAIPDGFVLVPKHRLKAERERCAVTAESASLDDNKWIIAAAIRNLEDE